MLWKHNAACKGVFSSISAMSYVVKYTVPQKTVSILSERKAALLTEACKSHIRLTKITQSRERNKAMEQKEEPLYRSTSISGIPGAFVGHSFPGYRLLGLILFRLLSQCLGLGRLFAFLIMIMNPFLASPWSHVYFPWPTYSDHILQRIKLFRRTHMASKIISFRKHDVFLRLLFPKHIRPWDTPLSDLCTILRTWVYSSLTKHIIITTMFISKTCISYTYKV